MLCETIEGSECSCSFFFYKHRGFCVYLCCNGRSSKILSQKKVPFLVLEIAKIELFFCQGFDQLMRASYMCVTCFFINFIFMPDGRWFALLAS